MSKFERYHREIFFPEWFSDSMDTYRASLKTKGNIFFTLHAVEKVLEYCLEYGITLSKILFKCVNRNFLSDSRAFEFYAVGREIRKVCFRFSFEQFPVDLILVISKDGCVITVYDTNKGDSHKSLDKKLYRRS